MKYRFYAYDLEVKTIFHKYIYPELKKVHSDGFNSTKYLNDLFQSLLGYSNHNALNFYEEILKSRKPLIIDSTNDFYFPYLQLALTFYDPGKIQEFLKYQFENFKGNSIVSKDSFLNHLEFITYEFIKRGPPFDNTARLQELMNFIRTARILVAAKIEKQQNLIKVRSDCRKRVLQDLADYFTKESMKELKKLISGKPLEHCLIFYGQANQLCEYFKRLYYYHKIVGNQKLLESWILLNFVYAKPKAEIFMPFSPASVEDIISKKKKDKIPNAKMIGSDWLPYKVPSRRN